MEDASDTDGGYSVHLQLVNDRVGLIIMASLFSFLVCLVTAARFYARRLTGAALGVDDWLALVSLVFVLGLNGIFLGGTIQGAITGHSVVADGWPVTSPLEHLVQKYKYAFQITEKFAFGFIKLSFLFLWKRTLGKSRKLTIYILFLVIIVSAWSIAFLFITVFQCGLRWELNWAPIAIQLTECVSVLSLLTAYATLDLATDFAILAIPIPIIWKLSMPVRKKAGVTAIFGVGLFTIGAGIARLYYYLVTSYDMRDNPDFIADFTLFILWSDIEANVAMIVCCLPLLLPVLVKCRNWLVSCLNTALPGRWTLLSIDRTKDKSLHEDLELTTSTTTISAAKGPGKSLPWRVGGGEVITAGYTDSYVPSAGSPGITMRTEVVQTLETR
ncbi:hypothetical protein F4861DRAFT_537181 [Xylaria intraflava]|nr:hypothetical protein F4861DRAFT_537181 [Xylaria intraflava]